MYLSEHKNAIYNIIPLKHYKITSVNPSLNGKFYWTGVRKKLKMSDVPMPKIEEVKGWVG